jgi:demethylmenaquinone methyltransferase/2-methoxy-6-polyprenyl-1,4-benzoquinol methylase
MPDPLWREQVAYYRRRAGEYDVIFVDDRPVAAEAETYVPGSAEVVERRLEDVSRHRLVKLPRDAGELSDRLGRLGWQADVRPVPPGWLVGEASVS